MIDDDFEVGLAPAVRAYAGAGARPLDAGRLARDLVARPVDRTRPFWRIGSGGSTRGRLWLVPVFAAVAVGTVLAFAVIGARPHAAARLAYNDAGASTSRTRTDRTRS